MPPKKAAEPKVQPKRLSDGQAKCQPAESVSVMPLEIAKCNSSHLAEVHAATRVIEQHDVFADIMSAAPLGLAEGGKTAVFNLADFNAAMQGDLKRVEAGCNMFWQDLNCDPIVSHLPINKQKVASMAATRFAEPSWPGTIVIAVRSGENPLERKGALRRLSPPELSHALILAVARDVTEGKAKNVLERWRRILLSAT
jgi:hypothetical protein